MSKLEIERIKKTLPELPNRRFERSGDVFLNGD